MRNYPQICTSIREWGLSALADSVVKRLGPVTTVANELTDDAEFLRVELASGWVAARDVQRQAHVVLCV